MNENKKLETALLAVEDRNATTDSLFNACRILGAAGRHDKVTEALNRLKRDFVHPGDLRFLLESAISFRDRGDIDEAHSRLSIIQRKFERNPHAYIIQADIFIERGELEAAQTVLESGYININEKNTRTDLIYRIIKIRSYRNVSRINFPFFRPTSTCISSDAALIMMVKDEGDIIQSNLEHHYRLGFRKFMILDNGSLDNTRDSIHAFSQFFTDTIVVTITDPVKAYFQGKKTTAASNFAKSYFFGVGHKVDWIFVLDADEFLSGPSAKSCLSDVLRSADTQGCNHMAFALCNATSQHDVPAAEDSSTFYERYSIIASYPQHLTLKTAFHANLDCRVTTGNHVLDCDQLDPGKCLVGAEVGWKIVHLPYRSIEQVARKVLNGTAAIQARGDTTAVGRHWLALGADMKSDTAATARRQLEQFRAVTTACSVWNPNFFRL